MVRIKRSIKLKERDKAFYMDVRGLELDGYSKEKAIGIVTTELAMNATYGAWIYRNLKAFDYVSGSNRRASRIVTEKSAYSSVNVSKKRGLL